MTPDELEEYARQRYNAVNDTFFASTEMRRYIYDAEMQLAREALCIRDVYTTSTVVDQQEYPFPSRTIMIKRVTYDGLEVEPRSLEEVLDLTNSVASPTGTPYIYAIWNETLYLGPKPAEVKDLKIFSINEPAEVENASVLDVPSRYHLDMAEYINWQMAVKDKNYQGAALHKENWRDVLVRAKSFERKMLRGQQFSFVKDVDRDVDSWNIIR